MGNGALHRLTLNFWGLENFQRFPFWAQDRVRCKSIFVDVFAGVKSDKLVFNLLWARGHVKLNVDQIKDLNKYWHWGSSDISKRF